MFSTCGEQKAGLVLYVEDDENDALFLQIAYSQAGLSHALKIVGNGQIAIDYLAGNGPFANREQNPLPCLVLLDLKLPVKNGFEVLEWIRTHREFSNLPVVVYSASSQDEDRQRAESLHASEYRVKTVKTREIVKMLQEISERWLVSWCQNTLASHA